MDHLRNPTRIHAATVSAEGRNFKCVSIYELSVTNWPGLGGSVVLLCGVIVLGPARSS